MPRHLTEPTDIPKNHGPLNGLLWRFYIAAGDPSLKAIAAAITRLPEDQQTGTAGPETVRRTLLAEVLPLWETVQVIFLALCELANVDPDDIEPDEDPNPGFNDDWEPPRSHLEQLHRDYQLAKYGSIRTPPRTRDVKARQEAEARAEAEAEAARTAARRSRGTFGDEPPF